MSWNGEIVIDLDSHIVERADRFYQDYIDPSYREAYQRLCDGVAQQAKAGNRYSLFGSRTSVIEQIETKSDCVVTRHRVLARGIRSGLDAEFETSGAFRVHASKIIEARFFWEHTEALKAVGLEE